jgi:ATP-dependent protease ClpP protease subunit
MPDWHEVFIEINGIQNQGMRLQAGAVTIVRHKYLQLLQAKTGRNVIAYYSGWLSKGGIQLSEINDEDKNGFMTTIHKLDRSLGLDLILHTPGGGIAATQSIVSYLHKMFGNNIRAIVPQIAMSAGTVMACCCKEILMGKQSNLGPIDPQMRGIPCHGAVQEFKRAVREVKKDPSMILVWQQIIGQYRPTFLGQCENALKWSNDFVRQQLETGMFGGIPDRKRKADKATRALSNYPRNKSHERHFGIEDCKRMGLLITRLEDDPELQDLVLTVHHCYMHFLMNTPVFKVIENHLGVGITKNVPQDQQTPNQKQTVE